MLDGEVTPFLLLTLSLIFTLPFYYTFSISLLFSEKIFVVEVLRTVKNLPLIVKV